MKSLNFPGDRYLEVPYTLFCTLCMLENLHKKCELHHKGREINATVRSGISILTVPWFGLLFVIILGMTS